MEPIINKARVIMANRVMMIVEVLKDEIHAGIVFELPVLGYPGILHECKGKIVDISVTENRFEQDRYSAKWPPRPDDPPMKAELI